MNQFWRKKISPLQIISQSVVFVFCISLASFYAPKATSGAVAPIRLQAAIFFKSLAYDGNIQARSGGGIVIGILLDNSTASKKAALLSGLKVMESKKIKGIGISIKTISNSGDLLTAMKSKGINMLYLPSGCENKTFSAALAVANSAHLPLLSGDSNWVKQGATIGLSLVEGKPKIIINLPASKKQGLKLSAKILQLATIIK